MIKLGIFSIIICFVFFVCSCRGSSQSEQLYNTHCANCHLSNGQGLGELIPSLSQSTVFAENREDLACLIRYGTGQQVENQKAVYAMPPNEQLSEIEITNILNYVRTQWQADQPEFSLSEIKKSLTGCNQ